MRNHKMSKRLPTGLLSGLLLAAFAFAGIQSAQAADLTIRFAWYMPPNTTVDTQSQEIAKKINSLSDGKIEVQTYPAGSLLKASNIGQGVSNNTANMIIGGMHWWANKAPALEWDTIPFLVTDASDLLKKLHGPLGKDVNKELNRFNTEVIGWSFYGYAKSYINTKHPVKVPSDLKGLKMRSEGRLSAAFLKSQGATPMAMDSSEVYTALQRGTLDGATSGLSSFVSRKWYEVAKYVTPIHYVPLVYPVQVNKQWWSELTQDQRNTIKKAVASTEDDAVASIEKEFKDDIASLKKNGNKVYRPTDEDLAAWRKATEKRARKNYLEQAGDAGNKILHDLDADSDK